MNHLKDQPIFDGPKGQRYLFYSANGMRDEYFLAGKMTAVSVVHGGPGPHFLSEDLVLYLAGQPSFKATVNDITEEEIKKALTEIYEITVYTVYAPFLFLHSTMLQTAGCLRYVATLEEKRTIVSD
ncbi:G2E3 ligase, partial [Polypterus senegalus]|nr:G2E3 ligase [Polypterus senegalus]